jgi:Na+-driven multidrug efflux pump
MALGAAVSSMAAQNVGAGKMDRVQQIARSGVLFALLFTGLPVLIIEISDPWVLQAFLPSTSPSLPIAVHINSIVLWGFIAFGMAFIFSGIVRATGAVWPPLLAMIVSLWGVRIPFANLLEPHLGQDAVWYAFPVGSVTTLVLAAGYYQWGGWRKSRMLPTTMPATDEADTGFGQPMIEGAEAMAEAAAGAEPQAAEPAKAR